MTKPISHRLDFETPMRVFREQTRIELSEDDFLLADDLEFREPWIFPKLTWQQVGGGWQLGETTSLRLGQMLRTAFEGMKISIAFLAIFALVVVLAGLLSIWGMQVLLAYLLMLPTFSCAAWYLLTRAPRVPPQRLSYFTDTGRIVLLNGEIEIGREAIEYVVVSASLTKRSYQRSLRGRPISPFGRTTDLRTDWQIVFRDGDKLHRRTLASGTSGVEGNPVAMTDAIPDVFSIKRMAADLGVPAVIVKFEVLQERFFVRRFE